ncbi:MAG: peptidoglycan DD-metalloendopeptidase family protein [Oscillospiraceae bacterium]|jgi:murein DD-endopeptidase MepM/ murein hydrolase activator NlpD|nr:peptidoglycan DD-metalloendopeptidase family protein [Oscillospiraceae bacterium]
MNKKFVRVTAIVLAVLLVLSIVYVGLDALGGGTASAVTKQEIEDKKARKREIESAKANIQAQIDALSYERASATSKKSILDSKISLIEDEIDNIIEQIALYDVLIVQQIASVAEAKRLEDVQWSLYKIRIRDMEEGAAVSYLAVLLNANDFADLLARIDFVDDIMRADEASYDRLVTARLETQRQQAELEALQAEAEVEKAEMLTRKDELEAQVAESLDIIAQIEESYETSIAAYQAKQDEAARIQTEIDKMTTLYQQQIASNVVGTGSLVWPSRSSSYVTSFYSINRVHPIYGYIRKHSGVDIGAAYGTDILAADSGTVIVAGYQSSYGNYVVINHGNGMTTLYAHQSRIVVKVGQAVSKGDVIGKVGSTGDSTGPHLHFEVRINGSTVDPLTYFKAGTYQVSPNA